MMNIDVCLSPELLHLYNLKNKIVVVVDILRATSCMVTAFANEVESITPVASVDECKFLQSQGYMAAAERDACKIDGFDLDNSPFSYLNSDIKNKKIAVTTTNGTLAITKSITAEQVIIGSFLNIKAVAKYIKEQQLNVLIVCAGWKGKINIEDTIFAGALAEELSDSFVFDDDSTLIAHNLYMTNKDNLFKFLTLSSHVKRLQRLNLDKDILFCLQRDIYNVVPILIGNELFCSVKSKMHMA